MNRRIAAVAAMITVALTLAGCVGIPSSGGVNTGVEITSGTDLSPVDLPHGPPNNAPPGDILKDFMQAATSPDSDYAIARQFLTTSASNTWNPAKSLVIREGSANTETLPDGSIDYLVSTKASVTGDGVYSEQSTTPPAGSYNYKFAKVKGQWRISSLQDLTILSRNSFEQVFAAHAIYFFDPGYRYLVPDVRWFPTGSTVPTRVVSALLAGPTSYLQGGSVVTAFPAGTALEKPVEVGPGSATVDLSAQAITGTKSIDKARMQQQLNSSLRSGNITLVNMTVRGAPLVVSPSTAVVAQPQDNAPLVLFGKRFGFAPSLAPIAKMTSQIVALSPSAVELGHDQTSAALLAKGIAYLVTNDATQPMRVDQRTHLIAPAIDPDRFVWTVPSSDASAIRATGPDGTSHAVTSSIPVGSKIVDLSVSYDGARLLLYLDSSTGPRLEVAGILRDSDGVPTGLGALLELPVGAGTPMDAAWVDGETVAAVSSSGATDTVQSYTIGGTPGDAAQTSGAVSIASGGSLDTLRLLTDTDEVQQLRTSGWQDIGVRANLLARQQ